MEYHTYNGGGSGKGGASGFFLFMIGMMVCVLVMQFFMPKPELPANTDTNNEAVQPEAVKVSVKYPVENRVLETDDYALTMTNIGGGRVQHFDLKVPDRYIKHGDFIRSQAQENESIAGILPLEMKLGSFGIVGETQFKTISSADDHRMAHFQFVSPDGNLQFDKIFTTTDTPYVVHAKLQLTNRSANIVHDNLSISMFIKQLEDEEPGMFTPGSFVAAKCYTDGSMEYVDSTDKDENATYDRNLKWFSVDESYFAFAMTADYATSCEVRNDDGLLKSTINVPVNLNAAETAVYEYDLYMGPKEAKYLDVWGEDRNLESVIDYGWMEVLAKPMAWILDKFHNWTGNWGLAIMLLTVIIRILLWPIAQKSQVSMMRMSKIAPLMQALQEKYKDDPATLQQKQMELYQTYKINPLGCLPLLLQMPVFFALYRCIYVTGGLYNAPFYLWITDLSARDPYFVLPILVIVLMVGQQLLTPSAAKNKQQKIMMYAMPAIFGLMMMALPSGLCLYIVVSTLFGIGQSFYVRRIMAAENATNQAPEPGKVSVDKDGTIDIEKLLDHKEAVSNKPKK